MGEEELPLTLYPPTHSTHRRLGTFWGNLWVLRNVGSMCKFRLQAKARTSLSPHFCKTCLVVWCHKMCLAYSAEVTQPQERWQLLLNNVCSSPQGEVKELQSRDTRQRSQQQEPWKRQGRKNVTATQLGMWLETLGRLPCWAGQNVGREFTSFSPLPEAKAAQTQEYQVRPFIELIINENFWGEQWMNNHNSHLFHTCMWLIPITRMALWH